MADNYGEIYTYIFYSVGIGALIGIVYDIFRIIRIASTVPVVLRGEKHQKEYRSGIVVNIIVFVCDILFFLIAAVISAIFIFYANNGRIRGIALFGSLCGFTAYYNTIGRLVTMVSTSVIRFIYSIFHFIRCCMVLPLLRWISRGCIFLFGLTVLGCNKLFTRRQTRRMIKRFRRKGC